MLTRRSPASATVQNGELVKRIEAVYNDSNETYASPRIYRELQAHGVAYSDNRVARLIRLRGLWAKQTRRYYVTSKRNKAHPVAPNVLQCDSAADRPDRKWLADIMYTPAVEGWVYLAAILDLYTRRTVGWAMSDRMTGALTSNAVQVAIRRRHPDLGLVHHSDQGS